MIRRFSGPFRAPSHTRRLDPSRREYIFRGMCGNAPSNGRRKPTMTMVKDSMITTEIKAD
jgi:hypothetical protein